MALAKYICSTCGYKDKPHMYKKGKRSLEIILWVCGILPGVGYTIWRNYTAIPICPICDTATMISISTPHGQNLAGH